jgi:hypothetical protein
VRDLVNAPSVEATMVFIFLEADSGGTKAKSGSLNILG